MSKMSQKLAHILSKLAEKMTCKQSNMKKVDRKLFACTGFALLTSVTQRRIHLSKVEEKWPENSSTG